MLKVVKYSLWILMLLPVAVFAASHNSAQPISFQAGKDYEVLDQQTNAVVAPHIGNVEVTEFFSYGCPACFHLEPVLEKWLSTKPVNINFDRVPVVFDPGWDVLAEAYYTAKNLGVDAKLTPIIFNAIHVTGDDLTQESNLEQLFVKNGVSKVDFESAFHFSPGIDAQMLRGQHLMRAFNIYEIPTLVVDGRYKTNIRLTNGDAQRLMQVVNFLIKKEQEAAKQ